MWAFFFCICAHALGTAVNSNVNFYKPNNAVDFQIAHCFLFSFHFTLNTQREREKKKSGNQSLFITPRTHLQTAPCSRHSVLDKGWRATQKGRIKPYRMKRRVLTESHLNANKCSLALLRIPDRTWCATGVPSGQCSYAKICLATWQPLSSGTGSGMARDRNGSAIIEHSSPNSFLSVTLVTRATRISSFHCFRGRCLFPFFHSTSYSDSLAQRLFATLQVISSSRCGIIWWLYFPVWIVSIRAADNLHSAN